LNSVINITLFR